MAWTKEENLRIEKLEAEVDKIVRKANSIYNLLKGIAIGAILLAVILGLISIKEIIGIALK